jgi:hypothetical protein
MYNIRLQVILTNIIAFLIFLLMPLATMLDEGTLDGESEEASLMHEWTMTRFAWACILG